MAAGVERVGQGGLGSAFGPAGPGRLSGTLGQASLRVAWAAALSRKGGGARARGPPGRGGRAEGVANGFVGGFGLPRLRGPLGPGLGGMPHRLRRVRFAVLRPRWSDAGVSPASRSEPPGRAAEGRKGPREAVGVVGRPGEAGGVRKGTGRAAFGWLGSAFGYRGRAFGYRGRALGYRGPLSTGRSATTGRPAGARRAPYGSQRPALAPGGGGGLPAAAVGEKRGWVTGRGRGPCRRARKRAPRTGPCRAGGLPRPSRPAGGGGGPILTKSGKNVQSRSWSVWW